MFRSKSTSAFTLVEVALAIALVLIALTVAVLAYRGYTEWGAEQATRENAQNLVNSVLHARAQGVEIGGNGHTFPLEVTVARANEIMDQIDGPIPVNGGGVIYIVPAGFRFSYPEVFPAGWMETSPGIFAPIP